MNHRDEIIILAMAVNGGLAVYIDIHNAIFRDAGTCKSFLNNLMGRGVPMSKLLEDSEKLIPLWDIIHEKVEVFRLASYSTLSSEEKHYFDILSRYVDALRKTVTALVDRQRLMDKGSKSWPRDRVTWKAFQENEKSYEKTIQDYITIGQELNDAAPIVFFRMK